MLYEGYKVNGYDASYEKTNFDVRYGKNAEKNRVLEITDINSGVTFIVETPESRSHKISHPRRKK